MKKRKAEKISMLMDEELNGAEMRGIVQEMRKDEGLMSCWENYHLISTALHKEISCHYRSDFSSRVSSALQNEPSYFLPRTSTAPVPTPKKVEAARRRGVVAYALAASVTALVLVGVMQSGRQVDLPASAVVASADNAAPAVSGGGVADGKNAAQLAFAQNIATAAPSETVSTRRAGNSSEQENRHIVYASMALESNALVSGRGGREAADGKLSYPEEAANLYDYLLNYRKYARRDTLQNSMYPAVQLVGYNSPQ